MIFPVCSWQCCLSAATPCDHCLTTAAGVSEAGLFFLYKELVLDTADTSGIHLLDGGLFLNQNSSACALTWYDGYTDALMIDVCIVSGIPPHA